MLRYESHSARMSKITDDGLAQDDSCTHMATVGVKGLSIQHCTLLASQLSTLI